MAKEIKIYSKIGELLIHFYESKQQGEWGIFCHDGQYRSGIYPVETIMEIKKVYEQIKEFEIVETE